MRIEIDRELCMAHGQCELVAPELFAVSEQGLAELIVEDPAEELRPKAVDAIDHCPEGAIRLLD
jgi:ferredoxin